MAQHNKLKDSLLRERKKYKKRNINAMEEAFSKTRNKKLITQLKFHREYSQYYQASERNTLIECSSSCSRNLNKRIKNPKDK